jgi:hypothetical protein
MVQPTRAAQWAMRTCAVRVLYKYHVRKIETFVPNRRQNLIPLTGLVYLLITTPPSPPKKKTFGKIVPRINEKDYVPWPSSTNSVSSRTNKLVNNQCPHFLERLTKNKPINLYP